MTPRDRVTLPTPAPQVHGRYRFVATAAGGGADAEMAIRSSGEIAQVQAALRRVATLVACGAAPEEVFAAVAEEIG